MKALVLAAGAGTRLRPFTDDRPKPMVPVAGTPAIAHLLRWLAGHGVTDVAVNLHHFPDVLTAFLGDGRAFGLRVHYSHEHPAPFGTAGALRPLRAFFAGADPFIVAYGDVLTDLDLGDLVRAHRAAGADATIAVTTVDDPTRAGIVAYDGAGRITRMVEKPRAEEVFSRWANAGVYACGPAVLEYVAAEGAQDFAGQLFPAMLRDGRRLQAYASDATVIDFGAPGRLEDANRWMAERAAC